MKPYRTILALSLLYAGSAIAGGIEIDAVTKHPSTAAVNVHEKMRGAVDESQWERWNSARQEEERAAVAKRAQEHLERAAAATERASRAIERSANADANESNARAGAIHRMYQPRPFQSGSTYGW